MSQVEIFGGKSQVSDKMSHLIFGGKNYLYFEPTFPSPSDLINWQRGERGICILVALYSKTYIGGKAENV